MTAKIEEFRLQLLAVIRMIGAETGKGAAFLVRRDLGVELHPSLPVLTRGTTTGGIASTSAQIEETPTLTTAGVMGVLVVTWDKGIETEIPAVQWGGQVLGSAVQDLLWE